MYNKFELDIIIKHDFYSYVQRVFYEITGGEHFIPNWHIEVLCYYLEQVRLGKTKRLIINVPPRSLKSIIVNIAFTTWILGHNPKEKIVSASYSADLSEKFARDCKIVMDSDWYKKMFPRSVISKSRSTANDFNTISRGARYTSSVEGAMMGRGGNIIIIDDPIKSSEAVSELALNKVKEWYKSTVRGRLNDQENGAIILIMQRVHEDDLTGYLLENSTDWTHIKMPEIATEDEVWDIVTKTFCRKKGVVLNKSHMSLESTSKLKDEVGTYIWSAQYQQEPCPLEGGIIKESWLKYYETEFLIALNKEKSSRLYISWDTANKIEESNAYSACCVVLMMREHDKYRFYLIDVIRGKWEAPALLDEIINVYNKWAYEENASDWCKVKLLIEDQASGQQMIQFLKQKLDSKGRFFQVEAIKPEGDKKSRLYGTSLFIENGQLLFPNSNDKTWVDFKKELLAFPGSRYKDQVDALSQCIKFALYEINQ